MGLHPARGDSCGEILAIVGFPSHYERKFSAAGTPRAPFLQACVVRPAFATIIALTAFSPLRADEVILVVGAPGEDAFGAKFEEQAAHWNSAAEKAGAEVRTVRDLEALRARVVESAAGETDRPLWIVLIGHGTFDERAAKFNLAGPDLTAADLAEWLKETQRPLVLLDTSAASAPFLKALAGPNRVVVTATKSGFEESYAYFGQYLATAIDDPDADLDRDGGVSVLEAFLFASKGVADFFASGGRIATEEAIIDDNGDGLGTPASWFRGVRATKNPSKDALPDGLRSGQVHLVPSAAERALSPGIRAERDRLEMAVFHLREKKASLGEDAYYGELEKLLLELSRLYESAPAAPAAEPDDS